MPPIACHENSHRYPRFGVWVERVTRALSYKLGDPRLSTLDTSQYYFFITRYDTKYWMRDLKEGAAYLPN